MHKASFFWRAGVLQRDLGKLTEAEQMALKGHATLDRFKAQTREDAEALGLRASIDFLLFRLSEALGKRPEAREYGAQAIEHQRKALEMAPGASAQIAALSDILMEVGRFHRHDGNRETADALLKEATERLSTLARQKPDNLEIRRLLAQTHYHKGLVYQESQDNASALSEFKLFIQDLEAIAHAAAADRDWQYELAVAYGRAASAHYALGSLDVCEALIAKWRAGAEALAESDPNNVLWRTSLAQSLAWSGLVARDRNETDPRVPELFGRAIELYRQTSVQDPNTDQYFDRIDEITANLVRYYKAANRPELAEKTLREDVSRHFDLAARFPGRFQQQRRLAKAFESLFYFVEKDGGNEEAGTVCESALEQLKKRFSGTPAPFLWHWTESCLHSFLANVASNDGDHLRSIQEREHCVALLKTLPEDLAPAEVAEELSYTYKNLVSLHAKRTDSAGFLTAANQALDWLDTGNSKPAAVAADLCLFICNKALLIYEGDDHVNRLLSRCRGKLLTNPAALEKFDGNLSSRAIKIH